MRDRGSGAPGHMVGEALNQVDLLQFGLNPAGVAGSGGGDEKVGGREVQQVSQRR